MKCLKYIFVLSLTFNFFSPSKAQSKINIKHTQNIARPKLVIGLVVDQMRWDYLYRFDNQYSDNGFRRLIKSGFNCENTFITHLPTYTAVGHAAIYTGSAPAINGIIGNNWYDRSSKKNVYCSEDSSVSTVGSNSNAGKMSPKNLWTNTITDELRLSNNFKSKVIGISLKDRGAIFPAGHSANAAYWFDDAEGNWITSTYYMNALPEWVNAFNNKKLPEALMSNDWNTLLPIKDYGLSSNDQVDYEEAIPGEKTNTFPHKLSEIKQQKFSAFRHTPFANTLSLDFAKAAIENEQLGKGGNTDFLTVSLSSADYIGHSFGPNSVEIQDTYLRLDRDIASFLNHLDKAVGKGNYLIFLTADHGAAHVPGFLNEHKLPGEEVKINSIITQLNNLIEQKFSIKKAILKSQNYQLYLDNDEIEKQGKSNDSISGTVIKFLKNQSSVVDAFELRKLYQMNFPETIRQMIVNGYNAKRSGDIQLILKPGFIEGEKKTGTTHGSWNPYDAHIPLVWYGWGIKKGYSYRQVNMTDIAATLAALLKIQMPNGCVGNVITELVR